MSGINILPNLGSRGNVKPSRKRSPQPVPMPNEFEDDIRTMEELQCEATVPKPRNYFWVAIVLLIIVVLLIGIILYLLAQSKQTTPLFPNSSFSPFLRQMPIPPMPSMPSFKTPVNNTAREAEQYLAKMSSKHKNEATTKENVESENNLPTIEEDDVIDTDIINPVEDNSEKKKSLDSLLFKQYDDNQSDE